MFPELAFHLKAVTRLIYFVTEEEDRFLVQLKTAMRDKLQHVKVYNPTFGLLPLADIIGDWVTKQHPVQKDTVSIHEALVAIYKEPSPRERRFYVILDPERWLKDAHVQRRVLNILHQGHNDINTTKLMICVSNHCYVPEKLARYTEVVHDTGLTSDEIAAIVDGTCGPLKMSKPEDPGTLFKGLTSYEIQSALIQSYKRTQGYADPKLLSGYRFRQLRKTKLVEHVDTSDYSFDQVGGVGRLKAWVKKTAASWTPEGRSFGLEPPKGVINVGVWGTGKSLSVKCLGNAWNLPVLTLDLGRLRQSGVGDSENNTYRAMQIVESVAPCILWIDEAEKSLSGGQSSAHTDSGTTSRMIGALSTWLQETKAPVCLALTANSLKTMPLEFVQRMDERWFFDLPSIEDRIDILKIHLKKRNQDPDDFNLFQLAEAANAMVGREMEQAIKAAFVESFQQRKKSLDERILLQELQRKPRIVRTMVDEIKETLEWVGYDSVVDDGVRARFAADPKGQDRNQPVE